MVVVCCDPFCQFHYRSFCRPERGHCSSSLGLCRLLDKGNHYRTIREFSINQQIDLWDVELETDGYCLRQSIVLYSRYGNGITTNILSKMIAGFVIPGRPIGNMYFAAWSHNLINKTVNLSNDLKMGEYHRFTIALMDLLLDLENLLTLYLNSSPCCAINTNLWHRPQ